MPWAKSRSSSKDAECSVPFNCKHAQKEHSIISHIHPIMQVINKYSKKQTSSITLRNNPSMEKNSLYNNLGSRQPKASKIFMHRNTINSTRRNQGSNFCLCILQTLCTDNSHRGEHHDRYRCCFLSPPRVHRDQNLNLESATHILHDKY